jgi:fluoroquinolone transport system ATP-binding protein
MKDLIRWLRQEGTTVFVTTHNMHVAEELCDRVGFILNGSLSELDSPVSLKQRYGRRNVRVAYHDGGKQTEEREFALDGLGDNRAFIDLLKSARHIESIHSTETTLDSVFVRVTGEGLE